MTTRLTGGCACGAVRYECSAEPFITANCHCRKCQRLSGAPFMTFFGVPKDAVSITGEVRYFESSADSGATAGNAFCPNCGSQLFGRTTGMPDAMAITASSLDDPNAFHPAMDIFTARAQAWDRMDPALPKFKGMPPAEPASAAG